MPGSAPANIAPNRPEVAMREPVLSASTSRWWLTGSSPAAGPTVSRIWPVHSRSKVRAWIRTASGPRSASRSEARANRKSPVRIATVLFHRAFADSPTAPPVRLVHHVVVVQRRQVGQLDHHGRLGHTRCAGVAELRGQQDQQRPEPLPAGVDEVARRLGDERVVALGRLVQQLLDPPQAQPAGRPRDRGRRSPGRTGQGEGATSASYRMKMPAWSARFSSGCGRTPSTIVTATPMATARVVNAEGTTTLGPSGCGSLKNISTITRT